MLPLRRTRICMAVSGALCASTAAQAQVTTDGTLGAARTLSGPNYAITADLGRQAGANLFHSFGLFNVPAGGSATFSGPLSGPAVSNIISRVTGGQASTINGLLRSEIGGANLFLINPRGILFGPNASLDLTGSFTASTANYLKLADGTRFEATATMNPILTSAPPAAFGFLGPTGEIALQGTTFDLATGRGISIVGGSVAAEGALLRTRAADSRLAAVATGEIPVEAAAAPAAGSALGKVNVASSQVRTLSSGASAPGRLVIRGGQLTIADSIVRSTNGSPADAPPLELHASGDLVFSGGQLLANAQGTGRGADIVARGENVTFDRLALVQAWSTTSGPAGDIDFAARNALRLYTSFDDPGWMVVNNVAFAGGNGGATRLSGDTVTVDGSIVNNVTFGAGNTGPVVMRGREVSLTNGAFVLNEVKPDAPGRGSEVDIAASERFFIGKEDCCGFQSEIVTVTRGPQDTGKVRIVAPLIEVIGGTIHSITDGPGNAGALEFEGDSIRFSGGHGGFAFVDTTSGGAAAGNGGNITVRASTAFAISRGDNPDGWSRLSTSTFGAGRGGDIDIASPQVTVRDGASLWVGAFGSGRGGDIRVRGQDVSVVAGGTIESPASGTARGGDIDIAASRRFYASEEIPIAVEEQWVKGIRSYTAGSGDAGNIRITAPEITLVGAFVHSNTYDAGNSGTLRFEGDVVRFLGGNSNFVFVESSAASSTTGNGGNVEIRARSRFELNGTKFDDWSRVAATTYGAGRGGEIIVQAPHILIEDGSFYSTTRDGTGQAGGVTLRADEIMIRTGGEVFAGTGGSGRGGSIRIEGTDRLVLDTPESGRTSTWWPAADGSARIYAHTSGPGAAGDVLISVPEIHANFGARIVSYTTGEGNAGSIVIDAQRVKLTGYSSIDTSSEGGTGNAGNIVLRIGESFEMLERTPGGAFGPRGHGIDFREQPAIWRGGIASRAVGPGNAGSVYLSAPNVLLDDARILTSTFESGRGGHTEIRAGSLTLRNGAQIDAKSIAGSTGDAGSIVVNVGNRFEISGMSPVDGAFSGVNAETLGGGRGGDVRIAAGSLVIDRGFVRSSTSGDGDAGAVDVSARDILLSNGGWIDGGTAADSKGAGGSVSVSATDSIVVRGMDRTPLANVAGPPEEVVRFSGLSQGRAQGLFPSTISSNTAGAGRGGNVTLNAPSIRIEDGGRVTATSIGAGNAGSISIAASDALRLFGGTISSEALNADGGNIDIRVGNLVHLKNSEITTAVGSGAGAGGNIFIDPTFVILENSRIAANAFGGPGGNIRIIATYFLNTLDSLIDASSQAGLPGTVQITSPNTNLSTQIKVLPATFFDATQLVREACAGRVASGNGGSSLVGVGRGGLAASPERFATSTYFAEAPAAVASTPASTGLKLVTATRARLAADCSG
jgi:filamentous hemagglutinin family protein